MNLPEKKAILIFDLDYTLADPTHRAHLIPTKDLDKCESWVNYSGHCLADSVIEMNARIIRVVRVYRPETRIEILTARGEQVREQTEQWLERHGIGYDHLEMRGANDNRPDHVIKLEYLQSKYDPASADYQVAVFDDNDQVVEALRGSGYYVVHVPCNVECESRKSHGK